MSLCSDSSKFLKQRALPNVLVYFLKPTLSNEEERSILAKIRTAIEKLCGKDRYVVYSVKPDDLKIDSKALSAKALLVITDLEHSASQVIFPKHLPKLTLHLNSLVASDSKEFDLNYFRTKLTSLLPQDNLMQSSSLEKGLNYFFDFHKSYNECARIFTAAKLLEYQSSKNMSQISDSINEIYFVDRTMYENGIDEIPFNYNQYFDNLHTKYLGHSLLFTNISSSTMDLANQVKDINGSVAVTNYQTSGIGRNANQWLSPFGCAMVTMNLQFSMSSPLMKRVSFIQHLASLSVILALPSPELKVRIKWPNDILYLESMSKMAGILVRSCCYADMINVQIGLGINVSNQQPSICLDDIIAYHNKSLTENQVCIPTIPKDAFIARVLTNFEKLLYKLIEGRIEEIKQMYCDNWIHDNQEITVFDQEERQARIIGIDDYGYLLAIDLASGEVLTLKPDGNRFDLMNRLLANLKS